METIDSLILTARDRRVILDDELARLYGVETKAFNQAIRRNADRFPDDFAFQLSETEASNLKSQIVTSGFNPQIDENNQERGQWGGRRTLPWVFTEHCVLMAANVLRSPKAVEMSIYLVRAFVRLREQVSAIHSILKCLVEIDRQLMQHDGSLRDLYRKLMPLLQPEPEGQREKRRLGFQKEARARQIAESGTSAL